MIWRGLMAVLVAALMTGVVWLGIAVADRSSPITDARVFITPDQVVQGEALQVNVTVFYRRSCWTYITRVLYDTKGERYAVPQLVLPPGPPGLQHSTSTIVVSPQFAVGEGRYVSHPTYGCNWFQRSFWPLTAPDRSAPFTVVKRMYP